MSLSFNHIYVVLIFKVKNPVCMKEFRFISFCNVVYKLIFKVFVNQLKLIFFMIIDEN